jgi:hypothetical protein
LGEESNLLNCPEWWIGLAQCGYGSPIFVFQESGQAFVDVNGSFMLSPDGGGLVDLIPAISNEPYWMAVKQPLPSFLQEYGRGWF